MGFTRYNIQPAQEFDPTTFNTPDPRRNELYVLNCIEDGAPHVGIFFLDYREKEPNKGPILTKVITEKSIDLLATHIGSNYHSVTSSRSGRFISGRMPPSDVPLGSSEIQLTGPVHKESFDAAWERVETVYEHRAGEMTYTPPKSNI